MVIVKKNGERIEETVLVPKGDPENPLTQNDIIEKLRVCAKGQADDQILMRLVDRIKEIEGKSGFQNPMAVLK